MMSKGDTWALIRFGDSPPAGIGNTVYPNFQRNCNGEKTGLLASDILVDVQIRASAPGILRKPGPRVRQQPRSAAGPGELPGTLHADHSGLGRIGDGRGVRDRRACPQAQGEQDQPGFPRLHESIREESFILSLSTIYSRSNGEG